LVLVETQKALLCMVIENTLQIKIETLYLRLSQDGITEISNYGMVDYFRDELSNLSVSDKVYRCLGYIYKTIYS
jgi:hypothetical protein